MRCPNKVGVWSDECGVSWFGYALLLALVATAIIVENELSGDNSAIGIDVPFLGNNEGRVFE